MATDIVDGPPISDKFPTGAAANDDAIDTDANDIDTDDDDTDTDPTLIDLRVPCPTLALRLDDGAVLVRLEDVPPDVDLTGRTVERYIVMTLKERANTWSQLNNAIVGSASEFIASLPRTKGGAS